MNLASKIAMVITAAVALAACDTSVTPTYQTSPQNTIILQGVAAGGKRVSVASFTAAPGVDVNPSCRLMGPIDVGGGQTPERVLHDALTAELLAAGIYSPKGTPLDITLTDMQVSSMNGHWILAGTVKSPKLPQGYSVQAKYDFKTSFSAVSACQNTALAFNKATSAFIHAIITHPSFRAAI
ncbi:hypothetical protein D2T29_16035 [Sinirhodobacter populi]|uniref:Lipoprotein n=1 Tax=Paenirhodobacter populi TaxID=2306993 RepID=A0A443K7H6_9RHOB|nr:hypothetical protein [Sinirhodobacter populi]RWR28737.1 hypothetical protein D2T29_16035 [Sinirhodobacter populi]